MSGWGEFRLACDYWRARLPLPRQLAQWLLLLVALQLCCSPLGMDLGLTLASLGVDGLMLLLDLQLAMGMMLLLTGWRRLGRWRRRRGG